MSKSFCPLLNRGFIEVSGADRISFLQGLITNDVQKLSPQKSLYAAFLSAQGKYLHDFFLYSYGDSILIDVEKIRLADLLRKLSIYKLRSNVVLRDATEDFFVLSLIQQEPVAILPEQALCIEDPRVKSMGYRLLAPQSLKNQIDHLLEGNSQSYAIYDYHRTTLGLPDGLSDLVQDKSILLENGFDELNAIDWQKGCYLGQELTARTRYRGLVRKRLLPVLIDGDLPPIGTSIMLVESGQEMEAGEIRSSVQIDDKVPYGLALLRLEYMPKWEAGNLLQAGATKIKPHIPSWFVFPESDKGKAAG